jgi:hypothetical protein
VNLGGLIEIGYEKIGDGPAAFKVGDNEVEIEARLGKKISGTILLRPDKEAENNGDILYEVFILLDNLSPLPISISVGKRVIPFGVFETHLISDPWTKEWEINQVGLIFSYAKKPLELNLSLYNSSNERGISFAFQILTEELTVGGSYRRQMGEDGVGINTLADLHGYIQYAGGAVTVDLEYCGAVIREDNEPKPSAYSFSLAYQLSEPLEIALRYDGFDDDDSSTLQSTSRIGAGLNYTLFEGYFEYRVWKD